MLLPLHVVEVSGGGSQVAGGSVDAMTEASLSSAHEGVQERHRKCTLRPSDLRCILHSLSSKHLPLRRRAAKLPSYAFLPMASDGVGGASLSFEIEADVVAMLPSSKAL